jgi:dethiobiotin synthetase
VPGVFIGGTDTGVGKTLVACALVRGLREAGIDVGVMKPVETGVPEGGPADALALREAARVEDAVSEICPLQYAMPATPEAAARAEGREVSLLRIEEAYEKLRSRHFAMLVEGAGGLLVGLDRKTTMADLAKRLGLPMLLVARATLGTINHTLLSIEACERRGIELLGVIVSHSTGALSEADAANLQVLRETLGGKLIGEVLPCATKDWPGPESVGVSVIRNHLVGAAAV